MASEKKTFSRSAYAGKLREFPEIVFPDEAAFANRGAWREFFARRIGSAFDGRVILEIGCFDASYLAGIAADNPTTGFVGLDWKCKPLYDGAGRIVAGKLRNTALLRARAQDILKIFAAGELDEIWVFHPDPCDREVELKNRLMGEVFLRDAHTALGGAGSAICLKTDHPGYYQWTLALFGMEGPGWFLLPEKDSPRVKRSELMRAADLPAASAELGRLFEVSVNSADFWRDDIAQRQTAGRCFAERVTVFEQRSIRKRWPIYYFEVRKR